jgi:hypothetical protein
MLLLINEEARDHGLAHRSRFPERPAADQDAELYWRELWDRLMHETGGVEQWLTPWLTAPPRDGDPIFSGVSPTLCRDGSHHSACTDIGGPGTGNLGGSVRRAKQGRCDGAAGNFVCALRGSRRCCPATHAHVVGLRASARFSQGNTPRSWRWTGARPGWQAERPTGPARSCRNTRVPISRRLRSDQPPYADIRPVWGSI